ncbi:MAG: glycosyltransferase [Acidobacteria bacterium]|nr:glycosyltransferase [Acidobacteriota bacterium]
MRVFTAPNLLEDEAIREAPMEIVILGLSLTSSLANSHAATYRGLIRALSRRGHSVLFLERDQPWFRDNRDLPCPPYCQTEIYSSLEELKDRFTRSVRQADLVIVGSCVPAGAMIGHWVTGAAHGATAFYDLDTPVTLAKLKRGDLDYLSYPLIPRYDLYLSGAGGPILDLIERKLGSPMARALYCSVDPELYYPEGPESGNPQWDLGYLGTYSDDPQATLDRLMLEPARWWKQARMVIAGSEYPKTIKCPPNVTLRPHLNPDMRRALYNDQRFTLNITRPEMVAAGYSPSTRLFEAAACATPIISDWWNGLETLFEPGEEILIAHDTEDTLCYLRDLPEEIRIETGQRARARVMSSHTSSHRAVELESHALLALMNKSPMKV